MTNYLTPAEVAERLGLSRRQVEVLIKRGELPAHKFGQRATRIDEAELAAYLQSRTTPSCN